MIKYIFSLILIFCFSCQSNQDQTKNGVIIDEYFSIEEHIVIKVYLYEYEGEMKASAMPELKSESELMDYKRRFEYLLINISKIHLPEYAEKRKDIWSLYPDTTKLKRLYLKEYVQGQNLTSYFKTTSAAITDTNFKATISFTKDELMEVASKFFYCDKVFPDTTIQSHVCVGLNGVSEANWNKDFTLLEAFCYEGIFDDLLKDTSELDESYSTKKKDPCNTYKSAFVTLDKYLLDVRNELFKRMKNDHVLKGILMEHYKENIDNLAFKIITKPNN